MFYKIMMLFFLFVVVSPSKSGPLQDSFIFNGWVRLDGNAKMDSQGLFTLTNATSRQKGHVFYDFPLQFKNSTNGRVNSFSTSFIFAIIPEYKELGGHGLAFVISPSKELPGALPSQYLGLFNATTNGASSNHIVAVELDTVQDFEFNDINDNHVGIDVNGLISIDAATAGYYVGTNGTFKQLDLKSGDAMQVWVDYNGVENLLNVTLSPIYISMPDRPLLSHRLDLRSIILDEMFIGFSTSTGLLASSHYILGWSFKMNGQAEPIDLSRLPKIPRSLLNKRKKLVPLMVVLAIVCGLIGFLVLIGLRFGIVLISRRKKFIQMLEDWEIQYGPHKFSYTDLYIATKGFKDSELLGRGGFGRVYRGVLPASNNLEVAVKRVSHDSRQGMKEFVAEIATIGRLRHQNLVRLLGYCRRKHELLLVYDFMSNGSLDKFLYGKHKGTVLSWAQRFKIIKDVALGLSYLHQQWVQVVIHRDIKASNVLIDSDFNGRLGDFGLAKLYDQGTDPETSHVAGTLGYIAPELARTGKANTSTDLFGFGAFMLEVACGRRPVEPRASPEEVILVDWVLECLGKGSIVEAIDPRLGTEYVVEEAELVLKLGLLCSHYVPAARPSISAVVQYLNGEAQLPDNLSLCANIKSRGVSEASDQEMPPSSVVTLTISEPFVSRGR